MRQLLLLHFRAHEGRTAELLGRLPELAREWCEGLEGRNASATVMSAHDEDLFRMAGNGGPVQGFEASLELELDTPDAETPFDAVTRELGSRLESIVRPESCAAQVGIKKVFRAGQPTSIRYQYCMKRRDDFTPEAYLRYYAEQHSRFGLEMEGVEGYTQVHLDSDATTRAMDLSGFSFRHFNSVSILHLASVTDLLEAGRSNSKMGFAEDEEKFVDRARSIMWISDEVFRMGP